MRISDLFINLSSRFHRTDMTSSPTSLFISALGIRVHYHLATPDEHRFPTIRGTLVLIHGFLSSTFTWNKCLQPLADQTGCQVIAYDRLAFGQTERVLDSERYSRKSEESLALELLRQLNITADIHLVSSSSGAVVAFDMAIARPDLIRSIIFVAPYGLLRANHPSNAFTRFLIGTRAVQSLMKFGLTRFLPFKGAYHNQELANDESIREGYLKPIRDDPLFVQSLALFTQHYDLSTTGAEPMKTLADGQKILIIIGEQDKIVPRVQMEEFHETLKRQRDSGRITNCVTIAQCGHLPQEERPEELVSLIGQFLAG